MIEIIQEPHPTLRAIAEPIVIDDIPKSEVQKIIADLRSALRTQSDGVGISAPQINVSKRIFIVNHELFEPGSTLPSVYINPVITFYSKKRKWKTEGCLSVRWKIGEVKRSEQVTVEFYDEHGTFHQQEYVDGLLGHIIQHETDHLDGILFIDKARDLRDMTKEEIEEVTKK